jgi:hypothetical protein
MSAPSAPTGPPQVVVPGAGWVDVATRAITTVGFPVVVAGALLWFLLTRFQTNMDAITTRMEHNAGAVEAFTAQLEAQTTELKRQTQFMDQESRWLAQMAADSARLVDMRRSELQHPPPKEPPR